MQDHQLQLGDKKDKDNIFKGIVNFYSCDSQKLYLVLTFTETLFLICLDLPQPHINF